MLESEFSEKLKRAAALHAEGRLDQASVLYDELIAVVPRHPQLIHLIGLVAHQRGEATRAIALMERSVRELPGCPAEWHTNLGAAYRSLGKLIEALTQYRLGLAKHPESVDAHNNLGNVYAAMGATEEAITHYQAAMRLAPLDAGIHSNLLYSLNFLGSASADSVGNAHRGFDSRFSGVRPREVPKNRRTAKRALRIGYISPDLRTHSVSFFVIPLFEHYDRSRFSFFAYADVAKEDETSDALRTRATVWRNVFGWSDAALLAQIRDDEIDILVDLAGHTARNRLPVFGKRAAPIQVSWLGYPNTTGLRTMDYRLTDAVADPESTSPYYSEKLVRLPRPFLCYRSPEGAPEVAAARARDGIVFGCFNNIAKVSPETIKLWSRILKEVIGSKLLLKSLALEDGWVRTRIHLAFLEQGIDRERVELRAGARTVSEHLAQYADVDVVLDPFPYNGTTTTLEALFMGTPVVARVGDRHASRVGASILTALGRPEWLAEREEDYVRIARELAVAQGRGEQDRSALRAKLLRSPLCDEAAFAGAMQEAFLSMWSTLLGELERGEAQ